MDAYIYIYIYAFEFVQILISRLLSNDCVCVCLSCCIIDHLWRTTKQYSKAVCVCVCELETCGMMKEQSQQQQTKASV